VAARVPKLRDERLCWLAVEDKLRRRSRRLGLVGWLIVLGSAGLSLLALRSRSGARMLTYSIAVDHVASFLDNDERTTLRTAGTVPPWFLYEVSRVNRAVRRGRPLPATREDPRVRRRRTAVRRWLGLALALTALAVIAGPAILVRTGSADRIGTASSTGWTPITRAGVHVMCSG
jgi:hypothetical protein